MHRLLPLAAVAAFALPAAALAAESTQFVDNGFEGHGQIFIDVKTKNGHFTKITTFGWSGLPCQNASEGAFGKPIKVKNNHFKDKNSFDGQTTYRVEGDFVKNGTKIKGTIKAKGACDTGKEKFAARANAEG
jgi:hypothetical protein